MTDISPKPAVSALIIKDGRVLLIKRGCEPNKNLWSLPGGSIEPGETLRQAAAREAFEETSLVVDVGDVVGVHEVISKDNETLLYHYVIITFRANVISGEIAPSDDAADAKWVSLDHVHEYPLTPGLADRLSSVNLFS
ncbi:NUDIX hydrolase [bacterium]|nr:NUDIX hydrolase [bacterium]